MSDVVGVLTGGLGRVAYTVSELGHVDRVQSLSDTRVRVRIMEGLVVWRANGRAGELCWTGNLCQHGEPLFGRGTSVRTGDLCSDGETMRVSDFISQMTRAEGEPLLVRITGDERRSSDKATF